MRGVDMLMAFPSLLLGLTVLAVLGAGLDQMIVAIGIVLAPPFARMVHGATLSLEQREFVEAARCLGAGRIAHRPPPHPAQRARRNARAGQSADRLRACASKPA